MPELTLVIGNKNYSSWSFRPWLALKESGLPFEEEVIYLRQPDTDRKLAAASPSKLVPVLRVDGHTVWDTMAIIETINELAPDAGLWPEDMQARATARSVCAEMHGGFAALRAACPMNIRRRNVPKDRGQAVAGDVARIMDIWRDCREEHRKAGPFLFGKLTAVDCIFAPVATRFRTYGMAVDEVCRDYMDAIFALPSFQEWEQAAKAETQTIDMSEVD